MMQLDQEIQDMLWTAGILLFLYALYRLFSWFEARQGQANRRAIILSFLNKNARDKKNLHDIAFTLGLSRARTLILLLKMKKEGTVTYESERDVRTQRKRRLFGITSDGQRELSLLRSKGPIETFQSS
jgi:DNA-binding PadR family transcriptional regulator